MKKNILFSFLVIGIMFFAGCASKRQAVINVDPENDGNVNFQEYNLSILTPSIDPDKLGTYLILKSEANETNARAENIRSETALKNAVRANPEKFKEVSLPISSYTDPAALPNNLKSVYVFNVSREEILRVSIAGAVIKNQPGKKMAIIPYGKKLGKIFLVKDPEIILYAYTTEGDLFRGPIRMYIPRKRMQAIDWDGKAYDKIVGLQNPKQRRGRYSHIYVSRHRNTRNY